MTLIRQQRPCLSRPDMPHRETGAQSVFAPLLRINVLHVEHARNSCSPAQVEHIRRHRCRKNIDEVDAFACQNVARPVTQTAIPVVVQHQRPARAQSCQRPNFLPPRVDREAGKACAEWLHHRVVQRVVGVIGQATKMHAPGFREVLDQVPGADTLTLVRRIRKTMGQEQHSTLVAHPNPRTINGPIRLASGIGSRFQAAMNNRYFGLSGLISGIAAPGASRKR